MTKPELKVRIRELKGLKMQAREEKDGKKVEGPPAPDQPAERRNREKLPRGLMPRPFVET